MRNAIVLLSGGLDSTTTMAIARSEGYAIYAMTIDYKQRHRAEVEAAKKIAAWFGAKRHVVIDIDLTVFGHSALTAAIDVPRHQTVDEIGEGIPVTYVPARNTIFLSYALAFAEVSSAGDIFIGVNAVDYSGYPDCRAEYIESFQKMANLATKAGVEGTPLNIHVPLIHLSKSEIIRKGCDLGVDYSITHSCYDPLPDGSPCNHCDSCLLRTKGFEEAGINDPLTS